MRYELRRQLEHLRQGQMLITNYKMRFIELSHHAAISISTEEGRVGRFIDGLHHGIRFAMDGEAYIETLFHQVVEIAYRIECIYSETREIIQGRDKRSRQSGSFSDASSGGRARFGRGHSSRPAYHAPPPNRGFFMQSLFNALPAQSSHRAPVIQGSSVPGSCGGYSSSHGSTQAPQSFSVRGCYECGYLGHVRKYCPHFCIGSGQ
ncbi:uncharacterized protein [Nicotiana tomentosiformis]|uniref:uncharacterized protein n=1 Tax=Nicotiana tomentosiformis TaxID=4098 RepID=UPI00388CD8B3